MSGFDRLAPNRCRDPGHGIARDDLAWARRFAAQHGRFDRGRIAGERTLACEQFEQHDTQRPDIDRGGRGLAADLLGRGVFRRVEPQARDGGFRRRGVIEQLGDAEVEQFHAAVVGDQDVAGLEIAVNDEPCVGVRDRFAHRQEQPQAFAQAEAQRIAVRAQVAAVDVFEREERLAVRAGAAVEQARDVGMLEAGEDLALGAEALGEMLHARPRPHQLQRRALLETAVHALGEVDRAHAALPDQLQQPPSAEVTADQRFGGGARAVFRQRGDEIRAARRQAGDAGIAIGLQQRARFGAQRGIVAAQRQLRVPLRLRVVGHGLEQCARLPPAIGIHLSPSVCPGISLGQVYTGAMSGIPDTPTGSVYEELLRIARAELARHRRGATLDTRSLVHEAWFKLSAGERDYLSRKHFYATAAQAMRQVVIDYARARLAERRGGGAEHVPIEALEGQPLPVEAQAEELVLLDAAIGKLSALDERLVQVVELRFFGGLEVTEIADLLGVSEATIKRDTRAARAFLQKELAAR